MSEIDAEPHPTESESAPDPSASTVVQEVVNNEEQESQVALNSVEQEPQVTVNSEVQELEEAVKAEDQELQVAMKDEVQEVRVAMNSEGQEVSPSEEEKNLSLEEGKNLASEEEQKDGPEEPDSKRAREENVEGEVTSPSEIKKPKMEDFGEKDYPAPIPASKEGTSFFNDADVLSGRGGGTNVHPGNRNFRDLINKHRRAYLKARKNDKPAISRAIVRSIRENNGRFLRKDDKSGLWFEVGDDAAREKTSQALRQRAPEMRKLLFDTEREEARSAAEDHLRHQRMMMGMPPDAPPGAMPPGMQMPPMAFANPAFYQAMAANGGKPGMPAGSSPNGQDPYQQMFQAAIMNNNPNRFPATNGANGDAV